MQRSLTELDGVFTYICVTEDSLGVAKDLLGAKPLVLYEDDEVVALASEEIAIRQVLDREITTHDPYEGEVRVWSQVSEAPAVRMDERGLVELDDSIPKTSKIEDGRATLDAAELTPRKINAELRWLIYEQGITDVTVLNPSARHSLGVAILTRCRIRFEGSLGYFGCGLIDGPEVEITGRVGLVGRREHDVRGGRRREQRRLARRRRAARRRPRRQVRRRRPDRDRPEGRHDHRRSATPPR